MNAYQELWWRQARSDHAVLVLLRRKVPPTLVISFTICRW